MDKAMYQKIMDSVSTSLLHLLSSAVLLMLLWLIMPIKASVVAVAAANIFKHAFCWICWKRICRKGMVFDILGIVLGAAMVVVLS